MLSLTFGTCSYEIKRGSSNPTSQNKETQAIEMEIACALTD